MLNYRLTIYKKDMLTKKWKALYEK